ncbi:MAG: cell division protein FtsQ/DivIB [Lentisphaeria bacterium]
MTQSSRHQKTELRFSTNRRHSRSNNFWRFILRCSVWLLITAIILAALIGGGIGLWHLLVLNNDQFTLREIDIEIYGDMEEEKIKELLAEMNVKPYEVNLFALDPGEIRHELEDSFIAVKRVTVTRNLPATLQVTLYQRDPIAQLFDRRGELIGRSGLVIPGDHDAGNWSLPIITGIPEPRRIKPGQKAEHKLIQASLEVLTTVQTDTFFNRYLKVDLIQIDSSSKTLRVFLGARRPFEEGSCLILPGEKNKIAEALEKVREIIEDRLKHSREITFIDATYTINVPVRP